MPPGLWIFSRIHLKAEISYQPCPLPCSVLNVLAMLGKLTFSGYFTHFQTPGPLQTLFLLPGMFSSSPDPPTPNPSESLSPPHESLPEEQNVTTTWVPSYFSLSWAIAVFPSLGMICLYTSYGRLEVPQVQKASFHPSFQAGHSAWHHQQLPK